MPKLLTSFLHMKSKTKIIVLMQILFKTHFIGLRLVSPGTTLFHLMSYGSSLGGIKAMAHSNFMCSCATLNGQTHRRTRAFSQSPIFRLHSTCIRSRYMSSKGCQWGKKKFLLIIILLLVDIATHYRKRKIVVFLSGDYEFLSRLYGLSGASDIR